MPSVLQNLQKQVCYKQWILVTIGLYVVVFALITIFEVFIL